MKTVDVTRLDQRAYSAIRVDSAHVKPMRQDWNARSVHPGSMDFQKDRVEVQLRVINQSPLAYFPYKHKPEKLFLALATKWTEDKPYLGIFYTQNKTLRIIMHKTSLILSERHHGILFFITNLALWLPFDSLKTFFRLLFRYS